MVKVELISGINTIFEQNVVDKSAEEVASFWTKAVGDAQDLKGYLPLSDDKRLVIVPMVRVSAGTRAS